MITMITDQITCSRVLPSFCRVWIFANRVSNRATCHCDHDDYDDAHDDDDDDDSHDDDDYDDEVYNDDDDAYDDDYDDVHDDFYDDSDFDDDDNDCKAF